MASIEKEATAIVKAVRKWSHLLLGHHFRLVTDQQSVSNLSCLMTAIVARSKMLK